MNNNSNTSGSEDLPRTVVYLEKLIGKLYQEIENKQGGQEEQETELLKKLNQVITEQAELINKNYLKNMGGSLTPGADSLKATKELLKRLGLSLEEARTSERCRLCGEAITTPIVLNYGTEYAHKTCLTKKEMIEIPQDQELRDAGIKIPIQDYWTFGGEPRHFYDCSFSDVKICDCGLLAHLKHKELLEGITYPKFLKELEQHCTRLAVIKKIGN